MADFYETTAALNAWQANMHYGMGDHTDYKIRSGVPGINLGEVPFNPSIHEASSIDHASLLGAATGEYYVREVMPFRPFKVAIVVDATPRKDHPLIRDQKLDAMFGLAVDLADAIPNATDHIELHTLVGPGEKADPRMHNRGETTSVPNEALASRFVQDISVQGLMIIISDFRRNVLPADLLSDVVAVKMNHSIERSIPRGIGFLSLGGSAEINTNKQKQVDEENKKLALQHGEMLATLRNQGVGVASVITKPRAQSGYDRQAADVEIAQAVHWLSNKHNN